MLLRRILVAALEVVFEVQDGKPGDFVARLLEKVTGQPIHRGLVHVEHFFLPEQPLRET